MDTLTNLSILFGLALFLGYVKLRDKMILKKIKKIGGKGMQTAVSRLPLKKW